MRFLFVLVLASSAGCGVVSAPAAGASPEPEARDCAPLLAAATAESMAPADTAGGIAAAHHRHAVAMHEYHRCVAAAAILHEARIPAPGPEIAGGIP